MFRQGPLSVTAHSVAEPFLVALLIAAPFLFGFSGQAAPTAVSLVAGVAILVVSMSTCWRLSLVKVVPLVAHAMLDLGLGALLVASPFLFGFKDDSTAATVFFILFGLAEILATLATRWTGAGAPDGGPLRPARPGA